MKIGIIGAGYIGKMLAKNLVAAGYEIAISNSRGPETLQGFVNELGSNATAVTPAEAAMNDVVLLSVQWNDIENALTPLKELLVGKVLIDSTNPFVDDKLIKLDRGASEIVASFVPGAHVIKAFNSVFGKWLEADPKVGEGNRVAFISGDSKDAKAIVSQIVAKTGFSPVDIGDLKTGAMQEAGHPLGGINLVKFS